MFINTLFLVLLTQGVVSLSVYLDRRSPRSVFRPSSEEYSVRKSDKSRLILTPLIESGNLSEARNLSRVSGGPFSKDVLSYSGFFTVNETHNSNMFFWFFPAEKRYETAPVILWLQGGPGASSLYGLFEEIGPYKISETTKTSLIMNPYSWHKDHSLLFIDNPVGTGFSFTENEGFVRNQTQVGSQLYDALIQFFTMFPELQDLPFYIAGESYAGKFIPAVGYTIHKRNPKAELKINLQGLAVGNGFTDPISMISRSHLLFQLGLIDSYSYQEMKNTEEGCKQLILTEKYMEALECWYENVKIFTRETTYKNEYNFMKPERIDLTKKLDYFLKQDDVRSALHVGDILFSESGFDVMMNMRMDKMKSVKPWLEELLEHYRVLYYSGQLDIIVAYSMSVNMYNSLNFSAAEEYRIASREPWFVDGELAGYMKSAGKFTEVLVRNAGHMVPADQPKWALDLINRFTHDNLLRSTSRVNFT
ncbi:hypothetical protein L9F63_019588 [Diploptera punctata]|uniref:Carboxypeptidase n=1 Tax=Diploptera punctata TaxID=6984 RepID=A0AAD7ZV98_DIPPU|nr:hypothetical protein L9F63_019588 [Diploptera punctata]